MTIQGALPWGEEQDTPYRVAECWKALMAARQVLDAYQEAASAALHAGEPDELARLVDIGPTQLVLEVKERM